MSADLLEAAYAERRRSQTLVGREMAADLAMLPPEEVEQAYDQVHRARYGVAPSPPWHQDVPASPVTRPRPWFDTTPSRTGMAVVEGGATAMAQLWRAVNELAQFGAERMGAFDALSPPTMRGEGVKGEGLSSERLGHLLPSGEPYEALSLDDKSGVEELTRGISQFMLPFLAVSRALRGFQLFKAAGIDGGWVERLATSVGNASARGALASVPVDVAAFDWAENNLVDIAKQFGFEPELLRVLQSADDDGEVGTMLANRVRAAVSNLAAGAAVELAVGGVAQTARVLRDVKRYLNRGDLPAGPAADASAIAETIIDELEDEIEVLTRDADGRVSEVAVGSGKARRVVRIEGRSADGRVSKVKRRRSRE